MKIIALTVLLAASIVPTENAKADVAPYETQEVNQHSFKSEDGTSVLSVSLERINRDDIREVDMGRNKAPEAWLGKRKLLPDVLWRQPTLITSFSLKIDDKTISIPERFWNDLVGLNLEKVVINKKPTTEKEIWELQEFKEQLWNPQVSRSADGGTVLITWIRPEECDSRSTIRWIVSKNSGTVMRHRHEPPHQ